MPKHLEHVMKNKKSICWKCGEEFDLSVALMQKEEPTCFDCSPNQTRLIDVIEKLGI